MIVYGLKDINGTVYQINGLLIDNPAKGSLTLGDDEFSFDNKVVEKSSLPGAVQLGKRRIMSRSMTLHFSRADQSDNDFKTSENILLNALKNAIYLVDVTNNKQVPISVEGYNIGYDSGTHFHSSDNTIDVKLLQPFWTSLTVTTTSDSLLVTSNIIVMSALGYLDTPGILTFTASSAVTLLQIYVDETKKGIQIEDSLFGTSIYTTLILDCENGTLTLGTLDRINSVIPGTGFFKFPSTASSLIIIPDAICDVSIARYERTYI